MQIKVARKPSSDPVQEKLRQKKDKWNKQVSELVDDLIQFKKMMNGWPSKFNTQKSSITLPVPKDPSSILNSLTSRFRDIASKANEIAADQLEYSKTRKKKPA